MTGVQPKSVVHRGSVEAAAFLFDPSLVGEAELRRRVLAAWQPGAVLRDLGAPGWLLLLPRPERVLAEVCLGATLVRDAAGRLLAAPLDAAELEALGKVDGVVLVTGGHARSLSIADRPLIDPAQWIDLDGWDLHQAEAITPVEQATVKIPPRPATDVRTLLGPSVPEAAPAATALLTALHAAAEQQGKISRSVRQPWFGRLRALFGDLLSAVRRSRSGSTRGAVQSGKAATGRSAFAKLGDWLHARFVDLLYWTRITRWLGSAQAAYFRKMLEMFEQGDLKDALRHAIPLGDPRTVEALRRALLPPRPRSSLEISMGSQAGTSTAVVLGDDLFALLRRKYEHAARQLEAQGRIEEAAFVCAELLADAEAAVALLERHGLLRKAAELAEGRELAPGLVVRQWFIAGDTERAIAIARRHGAFADALARLEPRHPNPARALRLLYGNALAEAGDYAGAVDVLWRVPGARTLATAFLERAFAAGGSQSGRSLARMIAVEIEPLPQLLERLRRFLDEASPNASSARLAFAQALLGEQPTTPLVRSAARAALRGLLGDAARGQLLLPNVLRDQLLALADDPVLRSDLPRGSARGMDELARSNTVLEWRIGADDAGTVAIADAVLLPDGRLLLALGDAGMRLYRSDLRSYTSLYEPADRLLVNPEGTRAIALAKRGRLAKLARVDLYTRRAESWCEAELDAFCEEFDGWRWFVTAHDALMAIDATAEGWTALWRVEGVSGRVLGILDMRVTRDKLELLVQNDAEGDYWSYELPSLKLRQRVALAPRSPEASGLHEWRRRLRPSAVDVVSMGVDLGEDLAATLPLVLAFSGASLRIDMLDERIHQADLQLSGDWAAVGIAGDSGATVYLVHLKERRVALRLRLDGATRVAVRLRDNDLLIADDRGRVRVHSLADGRLVCELRAGA